MKANPRAAALLLLAFAARPAAAEPSLDAHFVSLLRRAGNGLSQAEVAAWLLREPDGSTRLVVWPPEGRVRSHAWHGPVPAGAIALLHTHPADGNPRPSPRDQDVAIRLGIPVYTISRWAIWRVDPDDQTRPVESRYWRPYIDWELAAELDAGPRDRTVVAAGTSMERVTKPELTTH